MTVTKNVSDLSKDLCDLLEQKFSGEIALGRRERRATIHLLDGKLLYVTDNFHPVRRWLRAITKCCSEAADFFDLASVTNNYQQLSQALLKKQIELDRAQAVIAQIAKECFFELFAQQNLFGELTWKTGENSNLTESFDLTLPAEQTKAILLEATQLQQQWRTANLSNYLPTLAPVLEQEQKYDAAEIPIPKSYLQGNDTFWDIAAKMQISVVIVARSLVNLQQQNILKFQQIPDISGTPDDNEFSMSLSPPPKSNGHNSVLAPVPDNNSQTRIDPNKSAYDPSKPLIACIDDSPVLGHSIKKILASVGYQSMIIAEPMTGIGLLAKHRPDLILLDLLMPTVNGYSVCKFLRETNLFKITPIVILTSKDTIVDRTRARLAGATDFLTKPPDPQELLTVIRQHLIDIPWS